MGNDLSYVLFYDVGNVFQSATEMMHSFGRWHQPNAWVCSNQSTYSQCRFDYMSQAPGMGLRFKTPIGPVRIDASYSLNPPSFPFFVCPVGATCTVPAASTDTGVAKFQNATLRHFNFSFGIGQSF